MRCGKSAATHLAGSGGAFFFAAVMMIMRVCAFLPQYLLSI
jgi:hypothetical protein